MSLEEINEKRLLILNGALGFVDRDTKAPRFTVIVFISSTFTDSQMERNYLMDELLFELREHAKEHRIDVIFVDLRTGVRDESSLDHETWNVCRDMLNYCKEQSSGLFFFSLQGDKYGYRPIPKSVLKADMDTHLHIKNCPQDLRDIIFKWYILDTNAVPEEYVLKNMSPDGSNKGEFWNDFEQIFPMVCGINFDKRFYGDRLSIGDSVTSYEFRAAISAYPVPVNHLNRGEMCCWHHRHL